MVLVPVRGHDRQQFRAFFEQVLRVRQVGIDPVAGFAREHLAEIDQHGLSFVLEYQGVDSDLAQPPQRSNDYTFHDVLGRFSHGSSNIGFIIPTNTGARQQRRCPFRDRTAISTALL